MRMMMWKEWRENLKWALLAMIALGLAEFYALSTSASDYQNEGALLCRPTFLMATTFGTAAVGIILGFVQVLPELSRDKWASLLHRPVARTTLLHGKVAAGLLLYLVATVPPFLACVWYVATPGNYSIPFVPGMVLPGLADIVGGTIYYFAALFVALRRGGWTDPRPLAFPAALAGTILSMALDSFTWAVAMMLFFSATFFVAARGAMLSQGRLGDQPWLSRVALLAILLLGACGLGLITFAFASMFTGPSSYIYHRYEVTLDGQPLKFIDSSDAETVVTDLDGKVVKDPKLTSNSRYNEILQFTTLTLNFLPHRQPAADQDPRYFGYRDNRRYVIAARGSVSNAERWFYLPGERCFVGYIRRTNALIGAIGQEGFQPGKRQADPLPDPHLYTDYERAVGPMAQFGSTIYFLTLDGRKLTPLFTGPEGGIFGLSLVVNSLRERESDPWKWGAVALKDYVQIISREGELVAQLPYQWDVNRWGKVTLALNPERAKFYLWCRPSEDAPVVETGKLPEGLEELSLQGKVLHSYTLPPLPERESPESRVVIVGECVVPPAVGYGALAIAKVYSLQSVESSRSFARDWKTSKATYKTVAIRMSLTSLLLAGLTLLWARRMNFPLGRAWAWAAFVLAFNLPGLILFRLVADWPVRVKCPGCSRKRPVETETCPHCQAAWPVNPSRGTEIFEGKEEAVAAMAR